MKHQIIAPCGHHTVVRTWSAALGSVVNHGIEGFNLHCTNDLYTRRRRVQEAKTPKISIVLFDAKAIHVLFRN